MQQAGLRRQAPPRVSWAGTALWAGRIAVAAAAFAAGIALGHASDPLHLVLLAGIGGLAVAATVTQIRWALVAGLFLLIAYVPDVVASKSATHGLIAILLAGALLRWAVGREHFGVPRELIAFAALALVYVGASLFAGDRGAAVSETLDLLSYGAVIAMLMVLLDTPEWLRRAVWAVVAGVGLLALVAIVQQVTKTYGSSYGGFASILPAGDAKRSAGPLNPNPFGQILATSAVLAFYLARISSRPPARALAAAIAVACVLGVTYTQSRAALIALLIVAVGIGALHGMRVRVLAVAVVAVIALGSVVLPNSLQQRVGALSDAASSGGSKLDDGSLRGRKSENLAGLHMWADHPLLGVGPDNFEGHYQRYSAVIGIDPRPERRGAHNLYLESLAETGILGALAFLGVLWLALSGAWRARSRLGRSGARSVIGRAPDHGIGSGARSVIGRAPDHGTGGDALLGEGLFVALGAFLICALTLHSAYARYEWIFLGLGLAAGRLARRPAQ